MENDCLFNESKLFELFQIFSNVLEGRGKEYVPKSVHRLESPTAAFQTLMWMGASTRGPSPYQ